MDAFDGISPDAIVDVTSEQIPGLLATSAKISGVQPKFFADLDGETRLVPAADGRFIAKPQWADRKNLPENEHATMSVARMLGVVTAQCVLLPQRDGVPIYVTRRFDKLPGRTGQLYDFCQLLELGSDAKYAMSSEDCAEIVRQYSSSPSQDRERLFHLFVVAFWVGAGDLHLKNLSILDIDGALRLSPAYDLACGYVYGGVDLALRVGSRTRDLPRRQWIEFAARIGLDSTSAQWFIDDILEQRNAVAAMIERSAMRPSHRDHFLQCIAKRTRALTLSA